MVFNFLTFINKSSKVKARLVKSDLQDFERKEFANNSQSLSHDLFRGFDLKIWPSFKISSYLDIKSSYTNKSFIYSYQSLLHVDYKRGLTVSSKAFNTSAAAAGLEESKGERSRLSWLSMLQDSCLVSRVLGMALCIAW